MKTSFCNNTNHIFSILLIFCFFLLFTTTQAQQYIPVEKGSKIEFSVQRASGEKNKIKGWFSDIKGNINFEPGKPEQCVFDITLNSATAKTYDKTIEEKLKSNVFLDIGRFPVIHLKSAAVKKDSGPIYILYGNLTLKGITKQVKLQFMALPSGTGYIFRGLLQLKRLDYGIGPKGGIDDNVEVYIDIAANKK